MNILNIDDIDFSCIIFSSIMRTSQYKSYINIYYKNKDSEYVPFIIHIPYMYSKNNIVKKKTKISTHEIIASILSKKKEITDNIISFLKKLENKCINYIKNNCKDIFNSKDKIIYKSIIKYIDNDEYIYKNGLLKIKILKNNKINTQVLDENNNIIENYCNNMDTPPPFYLQSVIEVHSIWIKNNIFGITLLCHKLKISKDEKPIASINTFSYIDESSEEIDTNRDNINNINNINSSDQILNSIIKEYSETLTIKN